jgi:sensor domain CHASE-containing protein
MLERKPMDTIIFIGGAVLVIGSVVIQWKMQDNEIAKLRKEVEENYELMYELKATTEHGLNNRISAVVREVSAWQHSLADIKKAEDEKRRVAETKSVIKKLRDSIK